MAKCKGCGKSGLFLKIQNGLCSKCLESLFPSGQGAFGLTKDMFLNPDKYRVEPEPLLRNTSAEIEGMITALDGTKISRNILPSFFNLDGISIIDNNYYEITSASNIDRAKSDIISLNAYLDQAKRICRTLPDFRFQDTCLKFRFNPYAFSRDYSILSFSPLTKTGKVSNSPITLCINYTDNLHGKIMYDRDGNIFRAEVSTLTTKVTKSTNCIRSECTVHCVILSKQDGILKIRLIYRTKGGKREKIYDSKQ